MSKKVKRTLDSVMAKRRKSIQAKSRMLVECILAKDPLTANKIFPKLVTESQNLRELEVKKLILEDDDDWAADGTGDDTDGGDDTGDDTDGGDDWGDDAGDDAGDEGGDDESEEGSSDEGDEMSGDEESDDDSADQDTDKVINDTIEIQCQINAKIIENLFNVIADLKNNLNNQDLDETSKEFITLDTTISYYSDKLQELQNQTNPGSDQSKLEEKLDTISKALDELKEKTGGESSGEDEDIAPDMSSEEETSDEGTEDTESGEDEFNDEGEESSDETESEGETEEGETETEGEGEEETSEDEDTLGQA